MFEKMSFFRYFLKLKTHLSKHIHELDDNLAPLNLVASRCVYILYDVDDDNNI